MQENVKKCKKKKKPTLLLSTNRNYFGSKLFSVDEMIISTIFIRKKDIICPLVLRLKCRSLIKA
ncbi:hypothetical protein, partial [Ligilactobacillus pabuli]|uniref:hypothetical protein n=1 Tax=Ligilactobacillus pabuli TaxID=2886039 RepID=UPI001FB91F1C